MRTLTILLMCLITNAVSAQEFDKYFEDKTLRIDYIFSGDTSAQTIALDQLNQLPRWYGKRNNLAIVPSREMVLS